jgi:hypothetical protein
VQELEPPMERALELAWESLRAGSLGVGATVSRHGDVIATGRNRMAERDPGDDVLAPDPLFRGIERVRELNEFVGRRWPEIVEVRADEWAALSLLLHTHFVTFWGVTLDGWDEALPSIAGLAHDLVDSGELIHLAVEAAPVAETAAVLWDRLGACVPDVERIAATLPT